MFSHQFQQFLGSFGRAPVYQQDTIGAKDRQNIAAGAGDLEERVGEFVDFQGCCRRRRTALGECAVGKGYTSRATNEIPQESSAVR